MGRDESPPRPGAGTVVLHPVSADAALAILAGDRPKDVNVADDYPTEFSRGVVANAGNGSPLGPFFIQRTDDQLVVGEIGGGFVADGTVEIGYAVVESAWGRGHATDAVRALVERARSIPGIKRIVAHTPLDRPASARVLEKAGLLLIGQTQDVHEGEILDVQEWTLVLG